MSKWLLNLKEVTTRHGTAMIEADDIEDAVNLASDYFSLGPDHSGAKPTEVHFDSNQPYSGTEVSVKRECSPPGPYVVWWMKNEGEEEQELTFDTIELAGLFAHGIKHLIARSMGRIEHIEGLRYEGNGDWSWNPVIQMQWGEEDLSTRSHAWDDDPELRAALGVA